jgi:hypothetical protein
VLHNVPWIRYLGFSHLREEGSLDYDGGFVRLQIQTNFDATINRQHTTLHSLNSKLILALSTHKACASLWMSNFTLGWIGDDIFGVLHSSALPHNRATSDGRVEGYK